MYREGQLTVNAGLEERNGKMKMKSIRLKGQNRNILLLQKKYFPISIPNSPSLLQIALS